MCYFSSLELFLLVGGEYALFVFFVLATVVLRNAVISRVLAWFWVGFGKIAFFMTLFLAFWNLGLFAFFSRMLLFLEFLLVFASFSCL